MSSKQLTTELSSQSPKVSFLETKKAGLPSVAHVLNFSYRVDWHGPDRDDTQTQEVSFIEGKDTFLNQEQETFTNEIIKKFREKQVLESNNGIEGKKSQKIW